jgi:nucleotide-binding universal stress UspA family protein
VNDILVATDGSLCGTAAVEEALKLAARLGVGLMFVSVSRPPSRVLGDPFYERSVREGLRNTRAVIEEALDRAAARGVPADGEIIEGEVSDEIVALADNLDSSLIVLGSRGGHRRLEDALLGSVSAGVVQQARRPVLIVDSGSPIETRTVRAA